MFWKRLLTENWCAAKWIICLSISFLWTVSLFRQAFSILFPPHNVWKLKYFCTEMLPWSFMGAVFGSRLPNELSGGLSGCAQSSKHAALWLTSTTAPSSPWSWMWWARPHWEDGKSWASMTHPHPQAAATAFPGAKYPQTFHFSAQNCQGKGTTMSPSDQC